MKRTTQQRHLPTGYATAAQPRRCERPRASATRSNPGARRRQPVQPDDLDDAPDLRLGAAEAHRGPARRRRRATIARSSISEVSANVSSRRSTRRSRRPRGRATAPPAAALRGDVLVARAPQDGGLFGELDDGPATYTNAAATLKRMPTLEDVEDALTNVIDPELGLDFVELGLIYGVEIEAVTST